jgi:hypothetical protein
VVGPDFLLAWGYPRGEFSPEHMAIYGKTGRGKSHFELWILMERARLRGSRIIVICTKAADQTILSTGWPIVASWPPPSGWRHKRQDYRQVIYWPRAANLDRDGKRRQAAAIEDLLQKLWVPESNCIVVFDEIYYVENDLNMPPEYPMATYTARYLREGRSNGITVVASTQRPAGVSRYVHSETEWSVFFAPKDEEDAERMAQIAGSKLYYRRVLAELRPEHFEFLLVHNLTGQSVITSLPKNPVPITVGATAQEVPKGNRHVS